MMPWYVFALVDRPPGKRQGRGLASALAVREVPGGFAVVERRADVPPAELGSLTKHDAVVARLAASVPAILPVRFGTLLELDEMDEALEDREEELAEAFELVRGRVQFTWRVARGARGAQGAQGARGAKDPMSGTEYLLRAAGKAAPPVAFRTIREKTRPIVAAERYQAATPSLPESLYHLVERDDIERYQGMAATLAAAAPATRVTGPFPPFAFAPELL